MLTNPLATSVYHEVTSHLHVIAPRHSASAMKDYTDLLLHEQVLLLGLHDEKGTANSALFSYGIAGAAVSDLLLMGRLRVEESRRKKMLVVAKSTPTGVPLLDECLTRIGSARRRATVSTWVGRLASMRNLNGRVAERLRQVGLLRKEEGRFLLIFPRVTYPTVNPNPEQRLVEAMRTAIAEDGDVDPKIAIVIALTRATRILPHVLDKELLGARKQRLEAIGRMDTVAGATKEAIDAAQAAMIAATTATLVATSVATS